MNNNDTKKDTLWRIYLVYFFILLFGVAILARVIVIQFVQGDHWKSRAKELTTAYKTVEAVRGNIYDCDGSLLATSLPFYEVGMDVNTEYITREMFRENVDSLSQSLANIFKDRSAKEYARLLTKARKSHDRYVLLQKNVSHKDLQAIKKFPLFRKGRYKGGLLYLQTNRRERPFQILASRTIGYDREGIKPIGLEGAYNSYLKGVSGKRLMQKIAGDVWMPLSTENDVEPKDGWDVISTIDINLQDVAEHALMNQLVKNKAGYGCVVLMEVKTGEVKAIANLAKSDTGYYESFNYAIGAATEPGSTFKLASLMAAMEDGYIDLDDMVDLENGQHKYFDRVMKDSHEPEIRKVPVHRVFEASSNVGVSKIITEHYSKDPQKFIDRLSKSFHLDMPLGLDLPGEAKPRIKKTTDKDWYGTTLPWISIGYESVITPMQTLTLYNAVANDGVMVKPRFVKAASYKGKIMKVFNPEIIDPSICSKATIEKAKRMMEGVVQTGTAANLKGADYKVAGKTGTAQIANNGVYKNGQQVSYQASFVGYFPADNPKYSCIVIVNAPSNGVYYGNVVAGPIFKEIADKVYSTSLDIHKAVNEVQTLAVKVPPVKNGSSSDIQHTLDALKIKNVIQERNGWVQASTPDSTTVVLKGEKLDEQLDKGIVPDLTGMVLKDALFLLENKGIHVKAKGYGTIVKQSITPGERFSKGITIELELI